MVLNSSGFLTDSARGREPISWHHGKISPDVEFTWHHTIPWNCLAAVWNGLVWGQHWTSVQTFLHLVSAEDPRGTVQRIKSGTLMDRDRLHTQLTWQGWNIVEGPGGDFRSDDPKENYDKWSTVHGVSGNQRATIQAVDQLYSVMRPLALRPLRTGFQAGVPDISAADAKRLEQMMSSQMHFLRGKSPIKWNAEAWEEVQKGQVDHKLPALWKVRPIWRKRL